MRKSLLNVLILGVMTVEGNSYAAEAGRECKVPFKWNSAKVNTQAVDACVNVLSLQASTNEPLQIVGSATPPGTTEYNQRLSERRAENLKAALLKRVPQLKVEAKGIGEIPQNGLVARIVVEEDTEAKAVAAETINREELTASVGTSDVTTTNTATPSSSIAHWRIGPRLGQDHTRIEDEDDYLAPGLDIAYLPTMSNPHLRVEVGVIGNVYLDDDNRQQMASVHFAPGVGYQAASGFVAGVRGLAGVVDSDISDDTIDDAGGELRLGYEKGAFSGFLGAGQTKTLNRYGIDIGYRF